MGGSFARFEDWVACSPADRFGEMTKGHLFENKPISTGPQIDGYYREYAIVTTVGCQ